MAIRWNEMVLFKILLIEYNNKLSPCVIDSWLICLKSFWWKIDKCEWCLAIRIALRLKVYFTRRFISMRAGVTFRLECTPWGKPNKLSHRSLEEKFAPYCRHWAIVPIPANTFCLFVHSRVCHYFNICSRHNLVFKQIHFRQTGFWHRHFPGSTSRRQKRPGATNRKLLSI